ncbi:hypothetical protein V1512DRAFT_201942 [Lipomyces arxii]|uniref:uncharacterized protein n=1 Tax=Lipomyces arxii TaxID=56418 RepID=UPI0034CDC6AD
MASYVVTPKAEVSSLSDTNLRARTVISNASNRTIIPYAFDSSLGTNFTQQACPNFFHTFLQDQNFIGCYPFSFFLQNSESFFSIVRQGAFKLSSTMDTICSVNSTICGQVMNYYGTQLLSENTCLEDYELENPLVRQAYNAFTSYNMLYSSGCLKSSTGSYCYVDSVTNSTNPGDSYLYYLPLGISLPGGVRPSCSSCSQDIMSVLFNYAGNTSIPLSRTYVSSGQLLNINCGPNFVSTAVQPIRPETTSFSALAPGVSPGALEASIVALISSLAVYLGLL